MNRAAAFAFAFFCITGSADAGSKFPPIGYTIFCMNNAAQCRSAAPAVIELTAESSAKIAAVNASVNKSIRPKRDAVEEWSLNPAAGDCEDYALTKRAWLIRAGFPAGALRIATTRTAAGETHAVLVVKTTDGDFVLDNLREAPMRKQSSGYRFNWIASANPKIGE